MTDSLDRTQHDPAVPAERAERYRRAGWWLPQLLDDLVLGGPAGAGDTAPAITDATRTLSRAELAAAVSGYARRLDEVGIRHGDNIVLQLPNQIPLAVLALGAIRLGVRPVLTLPALREHELDPVLRAVEPVALAVPAHQRRFDHMAMAERLRSRHSCVRTLLVAGADGRADRAGVTALDRAAEQGSPMPGVGSRPEPSDVALYLLSSGTTGAPKPIPRTHEAFGHVIRTSAEVSGLDHESVYLAVMPATHSFAFGHPGILGTLACRGRVVLSTPDEPAAALSLIERERVTHCALAPALVLRWLQAAQQGRYDTSSLRVLQVGGARLDPATAERITEVLGCQVQQVYGMSEGLLNFTRLDDPADVVATTQGRPASPGDETLIVDDEGKPVSDGETGELLTRGPGVIAGYLGNAGTGSFTADGYYRTGDLVYQHHSGNLVVAGRVKDVINRGGEKIPADELEALVQTQPGVRAAAAVAMPHPILGEAVCLYLVAEGVDAPGLRDVRSFLEDRGLARFKLPERLVQVEQLPLKGVGKVDKVALRKDIAARLNDESVAARPGVRP